MIRRLVTSHHQSLKIIATKYLRRFPSPCELAAPERLGERMAVCAGYWEREDEGKRGEDEDWGGGQGETSYIDGRNRVRKVERTDNKGRRG